LIALRIAAACRALKIIKFVSGVFCFYHRRHQFD